MTTFGRRASHTLVALLVVCALGASSLVHVSAAHAHGGPVSASGVRSGDFTYDVDVEQKTATLTGWSGKRKKNIVIPARITFRGESIRVTAIGEAAFAGPVDYVFPSYSPKPATSVTIPRGIERIESFAFYGNKIKKFVLPASVEWIGAKALDQDRIVDAGWLHPLRKVVFRGDAPRMDELGPVVCSPGGCSHNGHAPMGIGNGFIVYFKPGAAGFTSPVWAGYLAAPVKSRAVPLGYGTRVADLQVILKPRPAAGVRVKAKIRPWAYGGRFSRTPKKLTYLWQLQREDGSWRTLGKGTSMRMPKNSAGEVLRVVTIAKGPGKREAVLQLRTVWKVRK